MQLAQIALYWLAYGVIIGLVALASIIFTYTYQSNRDRSAFVSIIIIISLTSLLATILLLPVDVALVSSTNSSRLGIKKEWATPEKIQEIVSRLKIFYITLYSVDAALCLVIIPFTYFFYEEYDDVEAEEGHQTLAQRIFGALKYTLMFTILLLFIFLAGFLTPTVRNSKCSQFDLDFFRRLIIEDHGERAITFSLGLLISIGTILYTFFTATGMAVLPLSLIKSQPTIDASNLHTKSTNFLNENRERQRQLQYRTIRNNHAEDHREHERLVNEERILIRRKNHAIKLHKYDNRPTVRILKKLENSLKPLKVIGGILLLCFSIIIWTSILVTGVDKAKNSLCQQECGYILNNMNIFQPLNYIFVECSKVFPLDNVVMVILTLFFLSSSVVGIVKIGIRFFWIKLLEIRKGRTLPQAMLIITIILALIILALNYSIVMMVVPHYATFGTQTFCDALENFPDGQPDCSMHPDLVKPCSELSPEHGRKNICTPSVISSALSRVIVNFKFYGAFLFWAQFSFLVVFLLAFIIQLFRRPEVDLRIIDELAEIEEEESLLGNQR
ncbi:putative lysosomal cobalamin transporter [Erysiphe neolycopersici]|uniref:Probable lysosomal cobalamin transporter n=1 Tax=Erysiphe neolycopersici TaxID=212602 RepID=A0A420HLY6_9PEZI|nr:putative lysosomal cobalamin transporter [Erysiphe neolycopersici]